MLPKDNFGKKSHKNAANKIQLAHVNASRAKKEMRLLNEMQQNAS